jgi:hypothetical protein
MSVPNIPYPTIPIPVMPTLSTASGNSSVPVMSISNTGMTRNFSGQDDNWMNDMDLR